MRFKSLSPEQGRALLAQQDAKKQGGQCGNKFGAQRTTTEHGTFDSKHEAGAVSQLEVMRMRGLICNLRKQESFDLIVNGVLIARYIADAVFEVREECELLTLDGVKLLREGDRAVVDAKAKATKTPQYQMKKRLMKACWGIEILEV